MQLKNYISCQRNISLLIVATFIMENQIVEAINHIKKISKKKPSVDRLLAHINSTTANNCDREYVEDALCVLRANGAIDENFKILSDYNRISPANDETTPLPGHPLTSMSVSSALTQTETSPHSPISNKQPIDFIVNDMKDEQINNLNAEVKALKSFIIEQLYVIKNLLKILRVKKTFQTVIFRFLFNPLKKS